MTPQGLRARVRAEQKRYAPGSGWKVREAMHGPAFYDGVWYPTDAPHELAGQQMLTEVYWSRDDPNHVFLEERDCPGLSKQEVEKINAPFRAECLQRMAVMTRYDWAYWESIWIGSAQVSIRRPIARARALEPERLFVNRDGGWMPLSVAIDAADQVQSLVRKRQQARSRQDWKEADALRRELSALGYEVIDFPHGSEWYRRLGALL